MFQTIACAQLDFDDTTFLMSYPLESPTVIASVSTVGVINPIVVTGCACQGKYQIVSGFRRAYACRELGLEQIQAQLYPLDPENGLAAFSLALYENLAHRQLNTIEKAIILKKLLQEFHCTPDDVLSDYMPALQVAPNKKILETYLKIADFQNELKSYLVEHDMPLSLLELLCKLDGQDRQTVFRLLSILKIGVNKMKELLTDLDEIALRDDCSIADILRHDGIQDILCHEKLSNPQKIDQIRRYLRAQRFPQLTTLEKAYADALRKLELPRGLRISADRFFEDDALTATFRFSNAEQAGNTGEALARLASAPELQALLDLTQGA